MVQPELLNLSTERVAMDAKQLCCFGLIAVVFLEDLANEPLLEFADGVLKIHALLDELIDQGFELLFHGRTPQIRGSGA